MSFYETLELVMKHKNIRAVDLCNATGISSSYFTKLKKGLMKDVTWDKALLIISALEMTPSEFENVQKTGVYYSVVEIPDED